MANFTQNNSPVAIFLSLKLTMAFKNFREKNNRRLKNYRSRRFIFGETGLRSQKVWLLWMGLVCRLGLFLSLCCVFFDLLSSLIPIMTSSFDSSWRRKMLFPVDIAFPASRGGYCAYVGTCAVGREMLCSVWLPVYLYTCTAWQS